VGKAILFSTSLPLEYRYFWDRHDTCEKMSWTYEYYDKLSYLDKTVLHAIENGKAQAKKVKQVT